MTEAVDTIFEKIQDLPPDLHPFVLSVLYSSIGAHYESVHDDQRGQVAWKANSHMVQEELKNPDKDSVLQRAVLLVTLPKHKNEQVEWVYRWLRGNGVAILQEESMRDRMIALLDDPQKGENVSAALHNFLDTDVGGLTMDDLFDRPEVYSMFVSFLAVTNVWGMEMSDVRKNLLNHVVEKWKDPEVCRVMDYFGTISDTKELYEKYERDKDWIMY